MYSLVPSIQPEVSMMCSNEQCPRSLADQAAEFYSAPRGFESCRGRHFDASGTVAPCSEVLGRRGYYRGSVALVGESVGSTSSHEHGANGPAHCGGKHALTEYLRQLLKVHGRDTTGLASPDS